MDAYIDAVHEWQQVICREVRKLVHAEVTETIKRTRQRYFVLQGNICALLADLRPCSDPWRGATLRA